MKYRVIAIIIYFLFLYVFLPCPLGRASRFEFLVFSGDKSLNLNYLRYVKASFPVHLEKDSNEIGLAQVPNCLVGHQHQEYCLKQLVEKGIRITPQMFGAIADGRTDDTTSLQETINAVCHRAASGGEIYFPPGEYRISSVLLPCHGVYLIGSGIGNRDKNNGTVINTLPGGNSAVFTFRAQGKNYNYGGGVRDISFKNDANSIYPMIEADYTQQFTMERIYSFGAFRILKIMGGRSAHVSHLFGEAILPGGTAIELVGSGKSATSALETRLDTPVLSDVALSAGSASGSTGSVHMTAIHISGFVATPQMEHVEILNAFYGVKIDCGGSSKTATDLGACPQFIDMRDVEVDFPDEIGIYAEDFQFLKFIGGYVHGSNKMRNAIRITNDNFLSYGADILGGKVDSSTESLIYSSVQGTHIVDMDLAAANSSSANSMYAGVQIEKDRLGSFVSHTVIANNTMCYYAGGVPKKMTGVTINRSLKNIIVSNNLFTGCISGLIYNGNSPTIVEQGNIPP